MPGPMHTTRFMSAPEAATVTSPAERWPDEAFRPVDLWALMQGQGLPAGLSPRALWCQACAEVARDRLNLEAHVRRVLLACAAGERVHVFDALVDCFLALGVQGQTLRGSLLVQARNWLDDESHEFLLRHLASGLGPQDPLPTHAGALLDPGLIGLPVVVRRLEPLPFDAAATLDAA
jgi:hypothetical protein